ncbi:unnamed protein product [Rhodiola kirilowii]
MRAALMWTVSDFPAYAMLSGWSTQGKLGCPCCMEDTKTFVLKNGRKVSYFGCHRRFLSHNHSYRWNSRNFYRDRTDFDNPVPFRSGREVFERVRNLKYIWSKVRMRCWKATGCGTIGRRNQFLGTSILG